MSVMYGPSVNCRLKQRELETRVTVRCPRARVSLHVCCFTLHILSLFPVVSTRSNTNKPNFVVLLTVHLSIFILVINQLYAQNLFYNKFISCLYMFRAHVLIVRRAQLYYTVSGIITPIGGRPVCTRRPPTECDDTRCCIIQF